MGDNRGETEMDDTQPDSVETDVGATGADGAQDNPDRIDGTDGDADPAVAGVDEAANRDEQDPADQP